MSERIEILFEQAYKEYAHILYTLAYKMLKDEAMASNAVQQVFTSLWENRDEIEVRMSLKGYLYAATKHAVLNMIRNRNVELKGNYCYAQILEAEEGEIVTKQEKEEKISRVEAAIKTLPDQQRLVLKYRMQGLSNPEIAVKLGIAISTVKFHYNEGLKALRQKMIVYERRNN